MKRFTSLLVAWAVLATTLGFSLSAAAPSPAAPANSERQLININTAGVEQLVKLPGIGEKIALRIVDYRKKSGNFKRAQDLMNVKGIGQKLFERLQALITV